MMHVHAGGKRDPSKPMEQVVSQRGKLEPVRVDCHGRAAHGVEIEAVFGLLDEVLHSTPVAAEPDQGLGWKFHVGHDVGRDADHLVLWLFHLDDDPARRFPTA